MSQAYITITNAHLHNLKNITVNIPKDQLVVLTGLSGSGKSTLAFDILYKEAQRQYLEALGMVAYGFSKPPVDSISGLSPSVSIDQYLTNRSPRSTVGTATDIYTYLRVLFARLGHRPCPVCGHDVPPPYDASPVTWSEEVATHETIPCPQCGAALPVISMGHFSFNKVEGACPTCTGLGTVRQANITRLINDSLSIAGGSVHDWDALTIRRHGQTLQLAAKYYGFNFDLDLPIRQYTSPQRDLLLFGVQSTQFRRHFPAVEPPLTVNQGRFEGVANTILRRYAEHIQDADYIQKLEEFIITAVCSDCEGTRLCAESRVVTVAGQTIVALSQLPLTELSAWLAALPAQLDTATLLVAQPILDGLQEWIRRVVEVGAGYLTLARDTPTLSAGESQRLRLASLLGSSLSGILYVFDEPTIGLHSRDNQRLIGVLRHLRDLGNTVLVVEHDLEVIRAADHILDFGPQAGKHGGEIIAEGSSAAIAEMANTLTGAYLAGRLRVPVPAQCRTAKAATLTIHGATAHNLQAVTVQFPIGLLIAVTGVSGSGKSSLVFDVMDKAGRQHFYGASEAPGAHQGIDGWQHFDKIVTIDQQNIGRIPRSNAATYSDVFTPIREAFAATPEARHRKMTARYFSFNVAGGRCERCEGNGSLTVKMHFLPDVEVTCPDCGGRRFKADTLAVTYRGHDIAQVLDLTIEEALALFKDIPAAASRLQVMVDVGLGYVQLGQPATTLSGGEAQRVKLSKELGRRITGRTLYLLDEPTTGLHPADTTRLLVLLQRLVEAGNTVIVVEHNLDLIRAVDWIIDMGPEGGAAGGQVIAQGTPEQVAQVPHSHTGVCLRGML